jgi:catechol 2,3-dioxygenase-like lactoylglutathione lyase family enzyme
MTAPRPIIDHIGINVTDVARSKRFYEQALAPLGIKLLAEFEAFAGFGRQKPELWIGQGASSFQTDAQIATITPIHICFEATDRAMVDAFHAAALKAGAKDFGKPGIRAHYHENYYGAFALDPDGHNVEAVFHGHGR